MITKLVRKVMVMNKFFRTSLLSLIVVMAFSWGAYSYVKTTNLIGNQPRDVSVCEELLTALRDRGVNVKQILSYYNKGSSDNPLQQPGSKPAKDLPLEKGKPANEQQDPRKKDNKELLGDINKPPNQNEKKQPSKALHNVAPANHQPPENVGKVSGKEGQKNIMLPLGLRDSGPSLPGTPDVKAVRDVVSPQQESTQPKVEEKKPESSPVLETQDFKPVDGTSLFIYSAYLDTNSNIRMFGFKLLNNYDPVIKCEVWLHNPPRSDEKPTEVEGKAVSLQDHKNLKYAACYIDCQLPPGFDKKSNPMLVTVSVVKSPTSVTLTIPIHQKENWTSEYTVCIPPLFNSYNSAEKILEMVEFNLILGATKFFFYNYSIGPSVNAVLNFYERRGIVEVVNWGLPKTVLFNQTLKTGNGLQIHYYGQLIAMNDCVYRNRHQSRYVFNVDVDEFVVPNITHSKLVTWGDLLSHRKRLHPEATVFGIRNVFFRYEFVKKSDVVNFDLKDKWKHRSNVLSTLYREDEVFRYGDKSKNIVDPLGVGIVGIHTIWEKRGPVDVVPEYEASLHHFRTRIYPEDPRKRIFDDAVRKLFGQKIVEGVEGTWKEIKKVW